jgi:hypothetical protein
MLQSYAAEASGYVIFHRDTGLELYTTCAKKQEIIAPIPASAGWVSAHGLCPWRNGEENLCLKRVLYFSGIL